MSENKTFISNIIKLNGFSRIRAAENILNGFPGLKYSYIQLDLLLMWYTECPKSKCPDRGTMLKDKKNVNESMRKWVSNSIYYFSEMKRR